MSGPVVFIATWGIPVAVLLYVESLASSDPKALGEALVPTTTKLYSPSDSFGGVYKAYAFVVLVNVLWAGMTVFFLGFAVGSSRKKFIEKATKDGDEHAEARFSYPKIYAEGFSEEAKKFNCVQRGHQHALETLPQFLIFSMIGGTQFPITCALGGVIWCYARGLWAKGYSSGEPGKRYEHWASRGIWVGLLVQLVATAIVGVRGVVALL